MVQAGIGMIEFVLPLLCYLTEVVISFICISLVQQNKYCGLTELPEKVGENYCNIEPLEPLPAIPSSVLKGCITSCYKASHVKSGVNYFMRRIHSNFRPGYDFDIMSMNSFFWEELCLIHIVYLFFISRRIST